MSPHLLEELSNSALLTKVKPQIIPIIALLNFVCGNVIMQLILVVFLAMWYFSVVSDIHDPIMEPTNSTGPRRCIEL